MVVPGVPPGSPARVKLVAWASWLGNSYAEAVERRVGGGYGESRVITIKLGGGILPPAALTGLESFSFGLIPEPSAAATLALGLVLLWPKSRRLM